MNVIISILLPLSFHATAHHGWSNYDEKNERTLQGAITSSSYENPHGTLDMTQDGKTWHVILTPPSRMESRGLTPEMLKKGALVSVVGYPHKERKSELRAERIILDRKVIELR